jgi:transcriptional regulator with XRE-family HTH domain
LIIARAIRESKGIRVKFVAEKVLGISPSYLTMIERGKAPMPVLVQTRLAKFYNVSPRLLTKQEA